MFFQRAQHHAARIFGHAAKIATHVDRAFGTAARIYKEVAPLAEQHLGREQARAIHGTITSGISHYNRARDTGLQIGGAAGRIAHALNRP